MKGKERHNPVAATSKESVTQRKSSCRISLLAQHHVWDLYLLPTRHFYSKSCYWWPLSSSSFATSPSLSDEDDYNDQVGNNHVLRRIIARWAQVTYVMLPPPPFNSKWQVYCGKGLGVARHHNFAPTLHTHTQNKDRACGRWLKILLSSDENKEKYGVGGEGSDATNDSPSSQPVETDRCIDRSIYCNRNTLPTLRIQYRD